MWRSPSGKRRRKRAVEQISGEDDNDDEFFDSEDDDPYVDGVVGSNATGGGGGGEAGMASSLSENISLFQSIHVLQNHEMDANETDAGKERWSKRVL
jgi:hypothetical protein